ncbi:MAG TPA: hypothetical protein VHR72_07170, partial [Gemmataceae bacterium]|nr:hypothetical protein [Gemmataceae bacterium]
DETDLREIAKLPFAPNFKRFSSYSTELTPAIIEALKAFPKFRNLTLPASRADDALLHALASDLPTLKHLALSYLTTTNDESRSVTTKGIAELSRMETLRLDVPDKETGKDWCRVIGGFRDLRDLALDRGDHGGLGEIAKVPDLNRLTLSFSPVALDDSAIANLSKMKMLRYLDLRTTPATAAQTKALAAALPKCWIIWDQGSIKP